MREENMGGRETGGEIRRRKKKKKREKGEEEKDRKCLCLIADHLCKR